MDFEQRRKSSIEAYRGMLERLDREGLMRLRAELAAAREAQ
jgi:hypothetical protein